jgi:putative salt-induced outer membrane protein YdiY
MKRVISYAAAAVVLTQGASADVKVTDVEAAYSGKSGVNAKKELAQSINFGLANTTGNTKTLNINGKYEMSFTTVGYDGEDLKVAFDAGAFVTKNNGVKDNEEYTANLGLEQYVMDGWLGYASLNWLRNKFQNYDNRFALGAGVGKEIFNDGQHSLKLKLGTAYNIEDYSNTQATKKFGSLNEYLEYNNQLNDISKLYVKLGSMQNFKDFSNDYVVDMVAGFDFAVAQSISVSIEEEVRYDNLPPVGFRKTDTKSIVRVGYHF